MQLNLTSAGFAAIGNVTASDTEPMPLANRSTPISSVIIQADPDNTDPIYIGSLEMSAFNSIALLPGATLTIEILDLSKVYCLGASADQIVRFLALGQR